MKQFLNKALINFGMIQIALLTSSALLAKNMPNVGGYFAAFGFIYMVSFLLTFIPVVTTSFVFAYFVK